MCLLYPRRLEVLEDDLPLDRLNKLFDPDGNGEARAALLLEVLSNGKLTVYSFLFIDAVHHLLFTEQREVYSENGLSHRIRSHRSLCCPFCHVALVVKERVSLEKSS